MAKQAFRFLGLGFLLAALIMFGLKQFGYLSTNASVAIQTTETSKESVTLDTQSNQETTTQSNQSQAINETTSSTNKVASGESIKFVIEPGDYSFTIAQKLEESDIIDSAESFAQYLNDNNLSTILQNGTFSLKKGQSYEELGKILTTYPGN